MNVFERALNEVKGNQELQAPFAPIEGTSYNPVIPFQET
jgi:hypothetical protein